MVRLVFRPYTQLRRSICTSESLRTSIRVSPDFILAGHSSPSFGYQRARYRCAPVRRRPTTTRKRRRPHRRRTCGTPRECGWPAAVPLRPRNVNSAHRLPRRRANAPPFTFITPSHNVRTRVSYRDESRSPPRRATTDDSDTPRLARTLDSLVRVSRRVGKRPEDSSLTGVDASAARRPLRRRANGPRRIPARKATVRVDERKSAPSPRATALRRPPANEPRHAPALRRERVATSDTRGCGSAAEISNRRGRRARTRHPPSVLNSARPDSRALSVYPRTVSRTIELSLQSSFQLSLTVLVRYRSRGRI